MKDSEMQSIQFAELQRLDNDLWLLLSNGNVKSESFNYQKTAEKVEAYCQKYAAFMNKYNAPVIAKTLHYYNITFLRNRLKQAKQMNERTRAERKKEKACASRNSSQPNIKSQPIQTSSQPSQSTASNLPRAKSSDDVKVTVIGILSIVGVVLLILCLIFGWFEFPNLAMLTLYVGGMIVCIVAPLNARHRYEKKTLLTFGISVGSVYLLLVLFGGAIVSWWINVLIAISVIIISWILIVKSRGRSSGFERSRCIVAPICILAAIIVMAMSLDIKLANWYMVSVYVVSLVLLEICAIKQLIRKAGIFREVKLKQAMNVITILLGSSLLIFFGGHVTLWWINFLLATALVILDVVAMILSFKKR